MRECNYPVPDCACSYHIQSDTTAALSINSWQAGAHATEMNKSKHSTQVLTKGAQAVVSPTDPFVTKLRAGKCHDQTSVVLRNLKHYQVIFGLIKQEESKEGLSRGHYPKGWLQSPASVHPRPWTQSQPFPYNKMSWHFLRSILVFFLSQESLNDLTLVTTDLQDRQTAAGVFTHT